LHNGSYAPGVTHPLDGQKLVKPREKQVSGDASVPASMLRHRYTSVCNLLTNLCFYVMREETVLSVKLLGQIRNQFLQTSFCERLLNPNFEFSYADLHLRHYTKHYNKNAW
jgi:hypothetical protein